MLSWEGGVSAPPHPSEINVAIPAGVKKCNFYVEPGDTLLFSEFFFSVPTQGHFIMWTPLDIGVTTKYRVEDVIVDCREAEEPSEPPSPPLPTRVDIIEWRIEVSVVP